eukprot:1006772_1
MNELTIPAKSSANRPSVPSLQAKSSAIRPNPLNDSSNAKRRKKSSDSSEENEQKQRICVMVKPTQKRPQRGGSKPKKTRTVNQFKVLQNQQPDEILAHIESLNINRYQIQHEDNIKKYRMKLNRFLNEKSVEPYGRVNANDDFVNLIIRDVKCDAKKVLQECLKRVKRDKIETEKMIELWEVNVIIGGLGMIYTTERVYELMLAAEFESQNKDDVSSRIRITKLNISFHFNFPLHIPIPTTHHICMLRGILYLRILFSWLLLLYGV